MKHCRRAVATLLLTAIIIIAPSNSLETAQWNPFEAVSRIDDWFDKLNKKFDEIVRTEPNKQLIGSIDDLLTVLNAIETGHKS